MADLQRTIEILFNGVDNASATMRTIGGNLEGFGDSVTGVGDKFASITKSVLALDAAIAGLAVAALAANSKIEQETTKMANALGLPTAEAEKFAEVAKEIYKGGFGENLEDAFNAATQAAANFREASVVEIGTITEKALKLSSTFGSDFDANLSAVQTLMQNFGISSEQAFDLITTGFQKGLNDSGDFIDSINEYATQFSNGGADAGEFFSVLETGFQQGVLGTDKAADMFKEFRVRIQDDSKLTNESLQALGIDPVKFADDLNSGKMSAVEAFQIIQNKLKEVDDTGKQFRIGVGLMGTQFEDMGTDAALAVDTTKTKIKDLSGAMDKLNPDESLGKKFEQAFRTITTTIADADIFDGLGDDLGVTLDDIKESFESAFKDVDFSDIEDAFNALVDKISDAFKDMDLDLTTVEGMKNAIELVKDTITSLINVTSGMADVFLPLINFAKDAVDWFNELSPETQELAGQIVALGTALTIVGGVVAGSGALLTGIGSLSGLFAAGGALSTGIGLFVALLTGPAGLAAALGIASAAVAGYSMHKINSEHDESKKHTQDVIDAMDFLYKEIRKISDSDTRIQIMALVERKDFDAAKTAIDAWIKQDTEKKLKIIADEKAFQDYWQQLQNIPAEKETQLLLAINSGNQAVVNALLDDVPDEEQVEILAKTNKQSISDTKTEFIGIGKNPDGSWIYAEITAKSKDIDKVKKEIETIPSDKLLEIKLQGEIDTKIAEIEATAETAQAAFEWTAKVRIEEAQASAAVLKQAFESAGESVVALSSSVTDMFGNLVSNWNGLGYLAQWNFMDILEDQQDAQNRALESQVKLNEAQIKWLNAKAESLRRGDGLIQIDTTGIEPALEMVMWQIIEKVQIRASEEAADFLLGLGTPA